MKKLLYLFTFAVVLVSCTGNDDADNNLNPDTMLLKKMVFNDGLESYSTTISYNGTKIASAISSDGYKTIFTYTGNLITKVEEFESDDILSSRTTYEYNASEQLIKYTDTSFEDDFIEVYTYVHNPNGSISYAATSGSIASPIFSHTGTITATQYTEYYEAFGETYTTTFTYDDKNNPFKNITGFEKIYFADDDVSLNFANNVLTIVDSDSPEFAGSISYTYNAADFPITATESDFGETYTTQYTYQ